MLAHLYPSALTTIYRSKSFVHPAKVFRELTEQIREGLPIIPTKFLDETWQHFTTEQLKEQASAIGGFPLIYKTLGKSHGQGVIMVETAEALQSELSRADFDGYHSILRQYLHDYRHFRIIVVDGVPEAIIEYHKPADDFRTNASEEPIVSAVDVSSIDQNIPEIAVQAVSLRGSILGGVDILVSQPDNQAYIAEVNVPCFYPRAEKVTGIDVSSQLLAALIRKQETER